MLCFNGFEQAKCIAVQPFLGGLPAKTGFLPEIAIDLGKRQDTRELRRVAKAGSTLAFLSTPL